MVSCLRIAAFSNLRCVWALLLCCSAASGLAGAELGSLLRTVRAADLGAKGNGQAAAAWSQIVQADAERLPEVLAAIDGASPLAANWLRNAVETIAERAVSDKQPLPAAALERFVLDTDHDPRARRLAYEWLARVDETASDRLIPRLAHDPSVEFRRDAVARLLAQADQLRKQQRTTDAIQLYQQALSAGRDKDQIDTAAKTLRELGHDVDLPRHFGFLMDWHVIGPFDNTGRRGHAMVYPPEKQLDLNARHQGKSGPVRWQEYSTQDDYGMVDLNEPLGKLKEATGYAWTRFNSDSQRQVQLRLGCKNAWKLWLNGELIFQREEYHRGMRLDQYTMPVQLKPGANDLLLKLSQNEQEETWTVEWQFQLRVCDDTGTAIASRE